MHKIAIGIALYLGLTLACCGGCAGQRGAHQLGFIPVAAAIDDEDLTQAPADRDLYVQFWKHAIDETGSETGPELEFQPLIRIGYWRASSRPEVSLDYSSWRRELVDPSKANWDLAELFMIIDVANLYRYASLGIAGEEPKAFKRRLSKIAELLLIAADHNGDIYWRNLVANLESVQLAENIANMFVGGGAGATFASPTVGVILTLTGLLIDITRDSYVDGLEVDEYASLRESASLYRQAIRGRMYEAIDNSKPGRYAVQSVLRYAQDYAFTYSIKGALYAVQRQNEELYNLLITGESAWKPFFEAQRANYMKANQGDPVDAAQRLRRDLSLINKVIESGRIPTPEELARLLQEQRETEGEGVRDQESRSDGDQPGGTAP